MFSTPRRIALAVAGAAALFAGTASSAQAGLLVSSASNCDEASSSQVFLPWLDVASYFLAPGGDFESGAAGWSLTGDAGVTSGNEPWNVTGGGASSLRLPAGSSATSPAVCVGIEHPTIRFFERSSNASLGSSLKIEVLFEDATGTVRALTIGRETRGGWELTPTYVVLANLLPLLPGEHTAVAFRFTPEGTGAWQIDDVHVDPYGRY
jgi:hypothetical protein